MTLSIGPLIRTNKKILRFKQLTPHIASIALLCSTGLEAHSQTIVSVKAHADIELSPVVRGQNGLHIRGKLLTRIAREPIPAQPVQISLGNTTKTIISNEDGTFHENFVAGDSIDALTVVFRGSANYTKTSVTLSDFRATRTPLTLTLELSTTAEYPNPAIPMVVLAQSESGPAKISVQLAITSVGGTESFFREKLQTSATGRATVLVPEKILGPYGPKQVTATFPGNTVYGPATQTTQLNVATATQLTLNFSEKTQDLEGTFTATGSLQDKNNEGIGASPIDIFSDNELIATTTTATNGTFSAAVQSAALGRGNHPVHAQYTAQKPWFHDSTSPSRIIQVGTANSLSARYSTAALLFTISLAGTFLLYRVRPRTNWRNLFKKSSNLPPTNPLQAGLHSPNRPRLFSRIRPGRNTHFSGIVANAVTNAPIANALLKADSSSAPPISTTTDPAGAFHVTAMSPDTWHVDIYADGFIRETFSIAIPHNGSLTETRILLLPVREHIFSLYRRVAIPLLPNPTLWGVVTPRQLFENVRQTRPAAALAALTAFVEHTYFSSDLALEDPTVSQAQRYIQAALKEAQRAGDSGNYG